jgi:hypothetical protein
MTESVESVIMTESVESVESVIKTESVKKVKKTVLLAKYKKTMLFAYWISKKMDFTSEQRDKFEDIIQIYSSADEQNKFYGTFDKNEMDEMKTEIKIMNQIVKEDRKADSKRALENEEREAKRIKVEDEEEYSDDEIKYENRTWD